MLSDQTFKHISPFRFLVITSCERLTLQIVFDSADDTGITILDFDKVFSVTCSCVDVIIVFVYPINKASSASRALVWIFAMIPIKMFAVIFY